VAYLGHKALVQFEKKVGGILILYSDTYHNIKEEGKGGNSGIEQIWNKAKPSSSVLALGKLIPLTEKFLWSNSNLMKFYEGPIIMCQYLKQPLTFLRKGKVRDKNSKASEQC